MIRYYYKEWYLEIKDVDKIYRVGRQGRYPRPIIISFVRQIDADRLMQDKIGRDEMAYDGVRLGPDMTKAQRDQMRELKDKGIKGMLRGGKVVPAGSVGPNFGHSHASGSGNAARGWDSRVKRSDSHANAYDRNNRNARGYRSRHDSRPRNRHLVPLPRREGSDSDSGDEWRRRGWTVVDSTRHDDDARGSTDVWRSGRHDWDDGGDCEADFPCLQGGDRVEDAELVPSAYPEVRGMTAAVTAAVTTDTAGVAGVTGVTGDTGADEMTPATARVTLPAVTPAVSPQAEASAPRQEEHVEVGEQEAATHAGGERATSGVQREVRSGDCESEEEREGGWETAGDDEATEIGGEGGKGGEGAGSQVSEEKHDQKDETSVKEIVSKDSNEKVTGGGGKARQRDKKGESEKVDEKGKTETEHTRAKTRSTSVSSSGQTNLDCWRGGKRRLSIGEKLQDLASNNTGKGQNPKGGRGGGVTGKGKKPQKS